MRIGLALRDSHKILSPRLLTTPTFLDYIIFRTK